PEELKAFGVKSGLKIFNNKNGRIAARGFVGVTKINDTEVNDVKKVKEILGDDIDNLNTITFIDKDGKEQEVLLRY
ncbi:MAG: hypothetical protein WBG71_09390, partial [Leeuwenhoekiella sp.]